MADKDYLNIETPYNAFLEREEESFGLAGEVTNTSGGTTPVQNASDVDPKSLDGQSLNDIFIETWIKSRNYLPKKRGFYLNARDGYAEFTDVFITGSITATTGTIGGFTIGPDYIIDSADMFGLSSAVTGGDDVRFWAGASFANRNTAPFRVTEAGVMTANSGTFAGTLSAPSGNIGGFTIASSSLSATATGNTTIVSSGATAFAAGPTGSPTFTVTQAGALTVTGGTITGGTIRTSSGTTRVEMDSTDNTLIAYVSGNQRAFFGGLLGAVSVLPGGMGEVGGGLISTSNGVLTIFAGDPSAPINGRIRLEASHGTTIVSDNGSDGLNITRTIGVGRGIFIDYDATEDGTVMGLGMDLSTSGTGDVFAFGFSGSEFVSSAVGGSQDRKIRVRVGLNTYYIPCYTA